jgi:virginiamycin A acetyltransferase
MTKFKALVVGISEKTERAHIMILSDILYNLYKIESGKVRDLLRRILYRIEGGEIYSNTLRRIFKNYYDVEIGLYSHGGCFIPFQVDRFTSVGRYCAVASLIRIMNRNHPLSFPSIHAFFFNPVLGYCEKSPVEHVPIKIGNDVWIGHNAIILPSVTEIGNGAVIAAGSVVNKNVPPYAVVTGHPARIVRYRFSEELINKLLASRWWEKSIDELRPQIHDFMKPLDEFNKYFN